MTINFEESPLYQQCFETFDPQNIVSQIELISRQKITPGRTLLFFDEIQQCPKALQALRYFKEKLPELHLVAAGSLLEFALHDEDFSFPVGRVQFAKLYPLSFEEFLEASGDLALRQSLASYTIESPPPPAIHQHLLQKVKDYFIVGGMPASIIAFLKTRSFLEVKYVQKALWAAFESDFGKYAKKTQHHYLKKVFEYGPRLIGTHIKYARFDPDLPNPARDIKAALELLRLAGLIHPVKASKGMPLQVKIKESLFKIVFLDIGLVQQSLNIDLHNAGLMTGALAEQFVGQEILAASDPFLDSSLFFWIREKSEAEVDYTYPYKGQVFPIEVKAGKTGRLKSLRIFMEETKSPCGIKVSEDSLEYNREILSIPFYLTAHLARLLAATRK